MDHHDDRHPAASLALLPLVARSPRLGSSTNDRPFLDRKIAKYLKTGSLLVLDVDPRTRTIIAHSSNDVRRFTDAERFAHEAAPGLTFDVEEAFRGIELFD